MAKTNSERNSASAAAAMRTIAHDGYLAYIEWPVFLAQRLKQVEQHLGMMAVASPETVAGTRSHAREQAVGSVPTALAAPNLPAPVQPAASDEQPLMRQAVAQVSLGSAQVQTAGQPVPQLAQSSASDSAEGNLLRFLDNFDMQGEG